MGSNLGHLTNLKLFVDAAIEQGHKVSLAIRELQNVTTIFDSKTIKLYQAPHIRRQKQSYSQPIVSFSQLIHRQVFTNEQELTGLYLAWNSLFDAVNPDLVVYDHSPSALVASVGKSWQKWIVGSGFLIPRTDGPFMGVFPGLKPSIENDSVLQAAENSLLKTINSVLESNHVEPLKSVKHIYQQSEQQLLLTLPELDHFGARSNGQYLGVKLGRSGVEPRWLAGDGCKVFVYLRPFPQMAELFNTLLENSVRILLYARDIPEALQKKFQGKISFSALPVNLTLAYAEADYVISHGNHGAAAQALYCGVPQLLIPKQQEQMLLAKRVEQLGMGVVAHRSQPEYLSTWQKLTSITKQSISQQTASIIGSQPQSSAESVISRLMQESLSEQ
jgi:hypothetical protein